MHRKLFAILSLTLGVGLAAAPPAGKAADQTRDKKAEKKQAQAVNLVDLNTASEAELRKLPGVDAQTAQRIIFNRPFRSVEDLKRAGINAQVMKDVTPMVTVTAKAPEVQPKTGKADRSKADHSSEKRQK